MFTRELSHLVLESGVLFIIIVNISFQIGVCVVKSKQKAHLKVCFCCVWEI